MLPADKPRILMSMRILTCSDVCAFLRPLLLAALLAGCAAQPEAATPPPTPSMATAIDGPIRPAAPAIDGLRLNPLKARDGQVTYIAGDRKGTTAITMLRRAAEGTWKDVTKDIHTMVIKEDQGSLVMLSEEDIAENVAIVYDPPFVLLPAKVAMGEKVIGTTTMTVNHLSTGKRRDSGHCRYVVELVGMQKIATPAGEFDAYLFKTTREIDLSLAKVNLTIHTAHVPEVGIVMTRVEQKTKAIGIFSMSRSEESRKAK